MTIEWPGVRRDESVARGVVELLVEGGVEAVTMRAVARQIRASVATVGTHYSKELLWIVTAREFGDLHVRDIRWRHGPRGAAAAAQFLARNAAEVDELRVWHALDLVGRTTPPVRLVTDRVHDQLRSLLSRRCGVGDAPLPRPTLDRLWTVVEGLRLEQARAGHAEDAVASSQRCRELAHLVGVASHPAPTSAQP